MVRCLQLLATLALLALFAGMPEQALAHGNVTHATEFGLQAGPSASDLTQHSLSAPTQQSDESAHHPGCTNCCTCSGGACQGAATLPAVAEYLAPPVALTFTSYDALSPPRRSRASLEHPPKFFA